MTEHAQTAPQEDSKPAPTPVVVPEPESRLAQLHAAYSDAKAAAAEAEARLKVITDGIKAELQNRAGDAQRLELRSPHGPPLGLSYVERVTFDSKRFKVEHPRIYVHYARFGGSWTLRPVGGGEDE